jgi:hypothetical protein
MDTNTINKGKGDEKLILLKINLLTESVFLNGWEGGGGINNNNLEMLSASAFNKV